MALKNRSPDPSEDLALMGLSAEKSIKKKTIKEEKVDKKIEHLLQIYRKQDAKNDGKHMKGGKEDDKRNLRNKFGFSDSENEVDEGYEEYDKI